MLLDLHNYVKLQCKIKNGSTPTSSILVIPDEQ
jgi:hypothetical protein